MLRWRIGMGNPPDLAEFGNQLCQRRYLVITLDHRADQAKAATSSTIEIENRIDDGRIVGINDETAYIRMPGKMNLLDAVDRNSGQKLARVKPVIDAADVNIVYVEQQITVSFLGDS